MICKKRKKVFERKEGASMMEEGAAALEQVGKREGGLGSVDSSLDLV